MLGSSGVQHVDWIEMQYTDIVGRFRSTSIPYRGSPELLARIDGSSVGLDKVSDSDAILVADMSTFSLIPWSDGWGRAICDVYKDRNRRHTMDPRYITQKLEEYLKDAGMEVLLGVEVEFFVLAHLDVVFAPPTLAGYRLKLVDRSGKGGSSNYQVASDGMVEFRRELTRVLSVFFGINVCGHHHEAASSQLELDAEIGTPTNTADRVQTVKYVAKALAQSKGLRAVFMPKPLHGESGSGMHVHISLWRDSKNLFHDPNDGFGISQLARYFIGGLLHHARALAALVAPTVNSYRRLVPGFEAPVCAVWGYRNRSAAVRVPLARGESDTRIEFRIPDPSANPYIAVAAIAMAGMDGIKKSLDPGDPLAESAYEFLGMPRWKRLPSSLLEALDELLTDSEFLEPVFTEEFVERYVDLKMVEVNEVVATPSPVEFLKYQDV